MSACLKLRAAATPFIFSFPSPRAPLTSSLFPYTTLFRSLDDSMADVISVALAPSATVRPVLVPMVGASRVMVMAKVPALDGLAPSLTQRLSLQLVAVSEPHGV